jgi:Flp pilus assembly protein TadG
MRGGCRRPAAAPSAPAATHHPQRGRASAPLAGPARGLDRGSVSLWVVIFTFTTLFLLVLVVDGGQTMNAKSRAADIAEQAARAAADDINVADLRTGTGTVTLAQGACDLSPQPGSNGTPTGPAAQLVANYASGVPGATATLTGCTVSATTVGGTPSLAVTATVQLSVRPAIPMPPFSTITATAQETAYLACGSDTQREAC